ncbi:MAG: phosphotransferase [Chloroflexi bacterium]|nr:phosphotransferase [Chloroflexota bacterium]
MALIEDEFVDTLALVRRRGPELAIGVHSGGKLPRVHTAGHHPADVVPIRNAIRDQLGLNTMVLDCASVAVADGIARRLLLVESLDDGSATAGLNWADLTDVTYAISGEWPQSAQLDEWFGETAQQRDRPDGRDWTVPGWRARAEAWITDTLRAAGLGRASAIEQIRAWEFSCVLRVHTEQEDLFFKALPRSYAGEPRLAQFLADCHPGSVPGVVATHERERWLLMRACDGRCLEEGAPVRAWERAAAGYAQLQVQSASELKTLEALGCPVRDPLQLRTLIGPLLADETALLGLGEHGLSMEELSRLREVRPSLESACEELADGDIPLALEHGDLWSSNIYVSDDQVQFIDWTEASISHPFFSLMPLLESATWDLDPGTVPALQARVIDAYLERWTAYSTPARLRRALALARPLAALHIASTYWRDIPQPHHQWWIPRMVPFFVRMALEQWDSIEYYRF